MDPKYFWTQIVFSLLVSLNLWPTISCVQNSLNLNFFRKWKVLDTRLLWPKNFSKRDQVDYLTVDTLSPVGTWRTWKSSVALLSLTCLVCLFICSFTLIGVCLIFSWTISLCSFNEFFVLFLQSYWTQSNFISVCIIELCVLRHAGYIEVESQLSHEYMIPWCCDLLWNLSALALCLVQLLRSQEYGIS